MNLLLGSSAIAFSYALRASSKRPSCSQPMPRLFQAEAYVGSISTAFCHRLAASRQRPFWATAIPKSTCALASDRWSAYAGIARARITAVTSDSLSFMVLPVKYTAVPVREYPETAAQGGRQGPVRLAVFARA